MTEGGQQGRRLCNGLFRQPFRPYAGTSGIAQEQASAPLEITPVHVPESRASASIQVSDKLVDQMFVKRANRTTRSRDPIHKVLGRSNVPPSGYLRAPDTSGQQTLQAGSHSGRRVIPGYVEVIQRTLST